MFSNPLNTALLPPILYLLFRIFFPSYPTKKSKLPTSFADGEYNWAPAKHPPVITAKKYTVRDLEPFNGRNPGEKDGGRILLAIARLNRDGSVQERTVFDVSNGRNFYGPDGMYGNFAGRDASRGMAKQSFDEDMLTPIEQPLDPLTDLTPSEIDNMHGWHEHFAGKYVICGELVEKDV